MSEISPQPDAKTADDVTVTTKPFALTPKKYSRILLRLALWNNLWLVVLMVVCVLVLLGTDRPEEESIVSIIIRSTVSCIIIFLLCFFYYWLKCQSIVNLPANKTAMKTNVLVLGKNWITFNTPQEGSFVIYSASTVQEDCVYSIATDSIYVVENYQDYYLIWLSQDSMHYLPKNAFASPEDLETFETKILPTYPFKNVSPNYRKIFFSVTVIVIVVIMRLVLILNQQSP